MKRKDQTTGGFNSEAWEEIRLDIDPAVSPDVVGSMTSMSAVPSGSVDAIFSSHNIEHLYAHEVPVALQEFLRVLSSDGFAVITCPDLKSVAALVADDKLLDTAYVSAAGPITPLDMLYGHRGAMARGNLFMAHHCGFTIKVLMQTMKQAGFGSVGGKARPKSFDLWAVGSKVPRSDEELGKLAQAHFP